MSDLQVAGGVRKPGDGTSADVLIDADQPELAASNSHSPPLTRALPCPKSKRIDAQSPAWPTPSWRSLHPPTATAPHSLSIPRRHAGPPTLPIPVHSPHRSASPRPVPPPRTHRSLSPRTSTCSV